MSALIIFLLSLVLVQKVSAQACAIALLNRNVISDELRQLLSSTSGIYYINLLDFHFTCLASGKVKGTYRSVSLLANYTAYGNNTVMTSHFAMQCFEDSWSYDEETQSSTATLMYSTELLSTTKRDCLRCNSDPMNICQGNNITIIYSNTVTSSNCPSYVSEHYSLMRLSEHEIQYYNNIFLGTAQLYIHVNLFTHLNKQFACLL